MILENTLATTISLLAIVLLVSFLARDYIQIVLDCTGGLLDVVILFMFPAM